VPRQERSSCKGTRWRSRRARQQRWWRARAWWRTRPARAGATDAVDAADPVTRAKGCCRPRVTARAQGAGEGRAPCGSWGAGHAQRPTTQSGSRWGGCALRRGVQAPPPPAQLTASPRLCHPRTAAGCPPGAGTRVERLVGGAPSVARLLLTTTAWPPPPRMAGPADAQRLCLCAWRLPVGRASLYSRPHPKPLLSLLPPLNAHSESKRLDARPPQAICQSREDPRPAPSIRHRSCQPIAHVQCFGGSIVLCQPQGDALVGGR